MTIYDVLCFHFLPLHITYVTLTLLFLCVFLASLFCFLHFWPARAAGLSIQCALNIIGSNFYSLRHLSKGSVPFSHSVVSDSLWPHGLQHSRPPCPSPAPGVYSNSCPLSHWSHSAISSSVVPFSCLQSFQHQSLFQWVSSSHQVAKVLEFQLQHQSFQWIFRTDFL